MSSPPLIPSTNHSGSIPTQRTTSQQIFQTPQQQTLDQSTFQSLTPSSGGLFPQIPNSWEEEQRKKEREAMERIRKQQEEVEKERLLREQQQRAEEQQQRKYLQDRRSLTQSTILPGFMNSSTDSLPDLSGSSLPAAMSTPIPPLSIPSPPVPNSSSSNPPESESESDIEEEAEEVELNNVIDSLQSSIDQRTSSEHDEQAEEMKRRIQRFKELQQNKNQRLREVGKEAEESVKQIQALDAEMDQLRDEIARYLEIFQRANGLCDAQ